jgi:hypothetical protein
VRDRRLGLLYYGLTIGIFIYVIFDIIKNQRYLKKGISLLELLDLYRTADGGIDPSESVGTNYAP